jgi:hypothetical protein
MIRQPLIRAMTVHLAVKVRVRAVAVRSKNLADSRAAAMVSRVDRELMDSSNRVDMDNKEVNRVSNRAVMEVSNKAVMEVSNKVVMEDNRAVMEDNNNKVAIQR